MTLLEKFKEELLDGKSVIQAFTDIDNYAIDYNLNNNTSFTYEIIEFCEYFKTHYNIEIEEIYEKFHDEPFVFFLYDLLISAKNDRTFLDERNVELDKRTNFELNKFKKNILTIYKKYGTLNIIKNGCVKVDEEIKEIQNDIYIQNEQQLETTITNNFLKVAFLLDYCIINILSYNEVTDTNVILSYYICNHSWIPISINQINYALNNLKDNPLEKYNLEIDELKKKY